jgi:glycosyltransferase involved in cell wall biosynthesis
MKILLVHNFYQQAGGEDQVFADELKMLRDRGHDVKPFTVHNDAVEGMGRLELARNTIWNRQSYDALLEATRSHRAEVVHFHNTFPLISPSGYRAAHDAGAAVVQTLHNYRLLCPSATFYRDGKVCEDCMGRRVPWPAVVHKCYRGNRAATAVVTTMLTVHRTLGTYVEEVDTYIACTEFSRTKLIEGGFAADHVVVKPNFVDPDPGFGPGDGGFALFVGRLTDEKGVYTLLKAWETLGQTIPLKILGDGPLRDQVLVAAERKESRIEYLGRQPLDQVSATMGRASVLLFPSQWYEGLPRTILESFAKGTPVIASKLGAMDGVIVHGRTGFWFTPGDAADLVRQTREALARPDQLAAMRREARLEYERYYTAARNAEMLLSVYRQALARNSGRQGSAKAAEHAAAAETLPPPASR